MAHPKPKKDKKAEFKANVISTIKELIIALIIIGIILGSLWGYAGRWPPVVVVESNSMMHGGDSSMGIMDTGDFVLVKKISGRDDIKTYVDGKKSDYQTYGSYGDVIGFKKNGGGGTPVIHRAVVWVEYNASGNNNDSSLMDYGSFDIPSLGYYDVLYFPINNYKPDNSILSIDLLQLLKNFQKVGREPHSGFLTKGDNNPQIDQQSSLTDQDGNPIEPVKPEWLVGKAEGELPALGLIQLFASGETSQPGKAPPPSSVSVLIILVALIIITFLTLHLIYWRIERIRRKKREEEEDRQSWRFLGRIHTRFSSKKFQETEKPPGATQTGKPAVSGDEMLVYLDNILETGEDSAVQPSPVEVKPGSSRPSPSQLTRPAMQPPSHGQAQFKSVPITASTHRTQSTLAKPVPDKEILDTIDGYLEQRED